MFETLGNELMAQALSPVLGVIITALVGWLVQIAYSLATKAKEKFGLDMTAQIQALEMTYKADLIAAAEREILEMIRGGETDERTMSDRIQSYWDRTSADAVATLQPTREFADKVVSQTIVKVTAEAKDGLESIGNDLLDRIKARLD